jgi:short-subunit dehydrogenase
MKHPHALVIGASSGIGLAIARRLKREGFIVAGLSRRPAPPDAMETSHCCDVLDADGLKEALGQIREKHGIPEVVVYSAGYPVMGETLSVPEYEGRRAFEVHFWGLDRIVRAVLPEMREGGKGTLVSILSIAALCPIPFEAYYSASKAAAAVYLRALASETRRDGVKIKWLAPGYVDTGFLERGHWFGMTAPRVHGSGTTPEDVAEAVLRLVRGGYDFQVLGWKERCLALAERISPGLRMRWSERDTTR